MAKRPHEPVDILLEGYQSGMISRRRIMALAVKMPALAAALAAGTRLDPGVAGATGGPYAAAPSLLRAQDVPQGGELQVANDVWVADTLNQHRSNFTPSRMVARHVLDCLTWVNPADGAVNPWLADSWEITPDGLEYTFTLKEGVTFHDGTPFNAEAVKANFDNTMEGDSFAYQALGGTAFDSAEVVDDTTLRVTFNEPHATFLLYLSDGGTGIDSPEALAAGGDDYGVSSLVGSGPYTFVEWVKDSHVTLEKNPDYASGPPAFGFSGPTPLDRLTFREVPENAVRAAAVVNGEVQMARIIEPNVPDVQGAEGVEIIATPKAGSSRMYLMNTAKVPTDDINVRRAINMAIDKETMLQLPGWAGFGRPGIAPLPSNMVPNGDLSMLVEYDIPYDLAGANALLDANGWALTGDIREKDGVQLVLDMVTTTNDVDAGQIEPIDGFLNEIGARLNIRAGDFNFWIDTVQATDFHMTLMSDSGYIGVGIIEEFFREGEPFANYGLANPELNELIDAAVAAPNLEEQWENLIPAMAIIMQEVVGVMGWEQDYLDAASTQIGGLAYNEVGFPWFYGTYLSQ
ncbi:MAG: ABC transporter substrate-binding protein [Thermomicrobiales bacterium]